MSITNDIEKKNKNKKDIALLGRGVRDINIYYTINNLH